MKTKEEKIKDVNYAIKVFKKALKDSPKDGSSPEAIKWGKKYLEKLKKRKIKLETK